MLCFLLNSCVTLPYMAFLLFLPLFNHHHSNVNVLFSIILSIENIWHSLHYNIFCFTHVALPNICVNKYKFFQCILMGIHWTTHNGSWKCALKISTNMHIEIVMFARLGLVHVCLRPPYWKHETILPRCL